MPSQLTKELLVLRKLLTLSCTCCMVLVLSVATNTAQARISYKQYKKLTLVQKLHHWKMVSKRHRSSIRFWLSREQRWRFDGLHPAGALVGAEDLRIHRLLLKQSIKNYREVLVKYRKKLALAALPAHYSAWLCIHHYEGAWNANTGNGYYGGLQMDYGFQRAYGGYLLASKGTANNWTPLEQMQVAERAFNSGRGFGPWPNTSRMCGLY